MNELKKMNELKEEKETQGDDRKAARGNLHFGGRSGWTCRCWRCELWREILGKHEAA